MFIGFKEIKRECGEVRIKVKAFLNWNEIEAFSGLGKFAGETVEIGWGEKETKEGREKTIVFYFNYDEFLSKRTSEIIKEIKEVKRGYEAEYARLIQKYFGIKYKMEEIRNAIIRGGL